MHEQRSQLRRCVEVPGIAVVPRHSAVFRGTDRVERSSVIFPPGIGSSTRCSYGRSLPRVGVARVARRRAGSLLERLSTDHRSRHRGPKPKAMVWMKERATRAARRRLVARVWAQDEPVGTAGRGYPTPTRSGESREMRYTMLTRGASETEGAWAERVVTRREGEGAAHAALPFSREGRPARVPS